MAVAVFQGETKMPVKRRWLLVGVTAVALTLAGCGPDTAVDPSAKVVELPGAGTDVDFDDVVYSSDLGQILVPARSGGVFRLDPATAKATRLKYAGAADSVDAGAGALFVLDRSGPHIQVLDPGGRAKSSVQASSSPDYFRYITATKELMGQRTSR